MHWMSESFADLAMLPPYNTLWAQLIRQGPQPEIVTEGVTIEYSIVGNTYSAGKTDFWDYVQALFGVNPPPNVGLTGATLSGEMQPQGNHFIIEGIPLTPYRDNELNTQYPYQLAHLVARDNETGEILAETTTVAPVSTETHCEACHADGMRESIATGTVETNILALHDRKEHTHLMDSRPVLCANCHASNALGMPGNPSLPSLSRAMHKKHAGEHGDDDSAGNGFSLGNSVQGLLALLSRGTDLSPILSDGGTENCYLCHPGLQTQSLRGTMAAAGMTCTDCHGSMRDVADGGRRPWIDEPRCGECHGPQYAENPGKLYRDSVGHGGLYCEACHGTPHAILASTEPNDNIQNIALQGYAGTLSDCTVCHGEVPSGPGPHGPGGGGPPPAPSPTPRPGHGDHHGYVKFHGTVESLPAGGLIGTWTVNGWTVNVSDHTRIDEKKGHVTVGAVVEVRGQRTGDHTIDAAKIKVKKPGEGRNYVSFNGTITSPDPCQPPSTCDWTVNDGSHNRTVHIRPDTRIEQEHGPPVQGAMVEVRGWQKADGTIDAYHIEVKSSGSDSVGYVKFHGVIRELPASGLIGDWRVDDIWVHVTEKTHIEHEHGRIRVGARVEVRGIQLADGTVNATKIKVKVKDD
ncbi:MAG: hypothetical protein D6791_16105 [Chloroflexi bacterium]|nr:MAG: hypothetical protein D6791_16105 [Chloroflexota bacterium]